MVVADDLSPGILLRIVRQGSNDDSNFRNGFVGTTPKDGDTVLVGDHRESVSKQKQDKCMIVSEYPRVLVCCLGLHRTTSY